MRRLHSEEVLSYVASELRGLIVAIFRRRRASSPGTTTSMIGASLKVSLHGYEFIKLLGEGAYSRVWLGKDSRGGYVAIKVSKPLSGSFPTQNEMVILAEEVRRAFEVSYARAMRRSSLEFSDNVVRVLDINMRPVLRFLSGTQPYRDAEEYRRDPPYIVMEYVPGGSVTDNRRIILASPKMLLCTIRQMVGAVKFINEVLSERVHGDVKPDNILIRSSGPALVPVLTDFGTSLNITWSGWLYGTPEYMPPEGLLYPASEAVSSSYDTYSLGLTIYELLTGEVPSTQSLLIAVSRHPLLEPERRSPRIVRLTKSFSEPPGNLITAVERIIYSEQSPRSDEIIERLETLEEELEEGSFRHVREHDLGVLEEAVSRVRQPREVVELIRDLVRVSPVQRPSLEGLLKRVDEVLQRYGIKCMSQE